MSTRPQPSRMRTDREYRRRVLEHREAAKRRQEEEAVGREIYMREHPDAEMPDTRDDRLSRVGQAVGRIFQTWRKRKPIIKGGAVIGYQKPGNTA